MGHCCPMHCNLFKFYCAPPNLGITRTWIFRLNFAQRPIFQAWGSLTSLKSQTRDPQLEVPPGGLVLRIFISWKNPSTSAGFEPANFGSRGEHVTPRPQEDVFISGMSLLCLRNRSLVLSLMTTCILWRGTLAWCSRTKGTYGKRRPGRIREVVLPSEHSIDCSTFSAN